MKHTIVVGTSGVGQSYSLNHIAKSDYCVVIVDDMSSQLQRIVPPNLPSVSYTVEQKVLKGKIQPDHPCYFTDCNGTIRRRK